MIAISPSCGSSRCIRDEPQPLPVPIIQPIDLDEVVSVAPEFEGMPLSFVLEELASPDMQRRHLDGLQLTDAQYLPEKSRFDGAPSDAILPTHLLVAHDWYGRSPSFAYPCHSVLLATHFSLLGPCTGPMPQPEGTQHRQDIFLPYPAAFDIIREYIYTHSARALVGRLLGLRIAETDSVPGSPEELEGAALSFSQFEGEVIRERASIVKQVHADATHMGLVDKRFWYHLQLTSIIVARSYEIWRDSHPDADDEEDECACLSQPPMSPPSMREEDIYPFEAAA